VAAGAKRQLPSDLLTAALPPAKRGGAAAHPPVSADAIKGFLSAVRSGAATGAELLAHFGLPPSGAGALVAALGGLVEEVEVARRFPPGAPPTAGVDLSDARVSYFLV
jgi:hypothetical protein